jgi:hypothetical protein
MRINYNHDNTPSPKDDDGGSICICNKCQNDRDREVELAKRIVPVIANVGDAKKFIAAGHPNTAAEWLIAEVERLATEADAIAEKNAKLRDANREESERAEKAENEVARLTDTLAAVMADEWRNAATLP